LGIINEYTDDIKYIKWALKYYPISDIHRKLAAKFKVDKSIISKIKHIVEKLHQSKDEQLDTETTRHHLAIEMGFHMHIIQAACNRVIMKHVITSHIMSRLLGELTLRHNTEVVNGAYQEHCQILEAIKTQNAEEARAFMARHIQNSRTQRIAQWDQTEAHQAFNQSASHSIPNDILVELNSMETGFFDME